MIYEYCENVIFKEMKYYIEMFLLCIDFGTL